MAFFPTYPQNIGNNPQTILSGQMYNVGIGGLGQAVSSGIGSAQWLQQGQLAQQQNPVFSLPPPTGAYTYLTYRDPVTGNVVAIHVDNSYAQILYDIIAMQGINTVQAHSITITTVPDDEFSLDEMGQAEDLILEIQHAH